MIDTLMDQFTQTLTPEQKDKYTNDTLTGKYYTYVLIRPDGTVFYVGKGTANRINDHERDARKGIQSHKCNTIREIWRNGGKVIKQKVAFFNEEADAFEHEILLVNFFGRKNLTNLTDGGEGVTAKYAGHTEVHIRISKELAKILDKMAEELDEYDKPVGISYVVQKIMNPYLNK